MKYFLYGQTRHSSQISREYLSSTSMRIKEANHPTVQSKQLIRHKIKFQSTPQIVIDQQLSEGHFESELEVANFIPHPQIIQSNLTIQLKSGR